MEKDISGKRKIDGVAVLKMGKVRVAEAASKGQLVFAELLQAAMVERSGIIESRVIRLPMANESEVESSRTGLFENRHVRVVGQAFVDFVAQGRSGRMRRAAARRSARGGRFLR